MPIQAPKEKPAIQQLRALRVDRLRPVERGRGVRQLALAVIERALAAPDAAEVKPQHRKVPVHEGVVALVDDLVVHRAAELRMRVQHDGDRRVLLSCRVVPALDPAAGPVKMISGIILLALNPGCRGDRRGAFPKARLTRATGTRKYLEPF